jgi:putative hydrolase of the HAD superfamily
MNRKAIILDLDNTIYPVSSIGNELFQPLFKLISENGEHTGDIERIKQEIMRKPFQKVAAEYSFSDQLTGKGVALLQELTYDKEMFAFKDYREVKRLSCKKFLATTGFTKMQQSKVKQLGIEQDFEEIHIVDPQLSDRTKKDVFKDIIDRHQFDRHEVLVIGDDPNSEIQAAKELGVDAVLYDKMNFNPNISNLYRITDFKQLYDFL